MGRTMFSAAVFHGNSVACWNIMPMSRRGPVTGLPCRTTRPFVGGIRPAMIFRSVDFPQPLEPMTEVKLPLRSVRFTSSSATTLLRA
jgi:hypothetical protein